MPKGGTSRCILNILKNHSLPKITSVFDITYIKPKPTCPSGGLEPVSIMQLRGTVRNWQTMEPPLFKQLSRPWQPAQRAKSTSL